MTDEIIPEFWRRVLQASQDGLAVDDFDFDHNGAPPPSELERLKAVQDKSALELVKFVLGHGLELLSLLREKE